MLCTKIHIYNQPPVDTDAYWCQIINRNMFYFDSWHGGNNNKNYFHAEKLKKDENWSLWIVYDKRFLLIPKPWITTITILTSLLTSGPQERRIDNLKNQAEIWRVLAHNFNIFSTLNATGSCCAGKYYTSYYSLYSY